MVKIPVNWHEISIRRKKVHRAGSDRSFPVCGGSAYVRVRAGVLIDIICRVSTTKNSVPDPLSRARGTGYRVWAWGRDYGGPGVRARASEQLARARESITERARAPLWVGFVESARIIRRMHA